MSATLVNMAVAALTESMVTLAHVSVGMRALLVDQVSIPQVCPIIIVILLQAFISRSI